VYSPFFFLQNAVCFIILTYLVPVLFTFYIQVVLNLKKNNPGAKRLIHMCTVYTYVHTYIHTYTRTDTHTHTYMPATNPTSDGLSQPLPSTSRHLSSVAHSCREVLKWGCAIVHYMLDAQLLLQPHFAGWRAPAVCSTSYISSLLMFLNSG